MSITRFSVRYVYAKLSLLFHMDFQHSKVSNSVSFVNVQQFRLDEDFRIPPHSKHSSTTKLKFVTFGQKWSCNPVYGTQEY